jgi:hypothetical protein
MDEKLADGSYAPGPSVRCVSCKAEHDPPTPEQPPTFPLTEAQFQALERWMFDLALVAAGMTGDETRFKRLRAEAHALLVGGEERDG